MRHLTCLARELCNGSFENIPPVPSHRATSNTQRPKEKRWQQRVCFHVSKEGHGSSKGCGQCSCEKIVGRFSELDRIFYMYIQNRYMQISSTILLDQHVPKGNVLCHHVSFVKLPMFVLSVGDSDSMKPQSLSSSLTMVQHNESSNAWHYSTKTSKQSMQLEAPAIGWSMDHHDSSFFLVAPSCADCGGKERRSNLQNVEAMSSATA